MASGTPLMQAVLAEPPTLQVIKLLLERGADLNAADSKSWTALNFAAQSKNLDVVKALLEAGAKANAQDSHGQTPLFRSVGSGELSPPLVQALLDGGTDPDPRNLSRASRSFQVWESYPRLTDGATRADALQTGRYTPAVSNNRGGNACRWNRFSGY
jgi:ankyrin repeat protein